MTYTAPILLLTDDRSKTQLGAFGSTSRDDGAMGKDIKPAIPPKLYRIGEVVEYAGVSRQTIHNYATMGLLREKQWTKGGHRLFGEDVFERLATITRMKADKKSMQDIRDHFKEIDSQEP